MSDEEVDEKKGGSEDSGSKARDADDSDDASQAPGAARKKSAEKKAEKAAESAKTTKSAKGASTAKSDSTDDNSTDDKPSRSRFTIPSIPPVAIAIALPLLFFFIVPPLSKSGIWDPFELNTADLARRVAINLHGATSLRLDGTDNSLPHLNDLGRPQLPFTAMAIGFQLFGLHEWAGRLPLAIFGLLGVIVTYGWVSRMVDKRAGAFAAVALTTMPLYFVQARTMLGDIATMAAITMSFGGLLVATFDRDSEGALGPRLGYFGIALVGLFFGFESRGAMIGLGIPLGSIGLAWLVLLASGQKRTDSLSDVIGALCTAGTIFVLYNGIGVMAEDKVPNLSMWIGAMVKNPAKYPTFDYYIAHVGHALLPWSAFVPFALGRLFISPKGRPGVELERESIARMALVVAAGVALCMHGWLAMRTELIAFSAPAILAAVCGIALRDYERGAHPSIAVGVGTAVFLGLFHHDMHSLPEKAFQAFAVSGGTFPESFKDEALRLWTVVLVGFAGVAFLTWVDRDALEGLLPTRAGLLGRAGAGASHDPHGESETQDASEKVEPYRPFDPRGYARVITALLDAWDGMLALLYFAIVAGASLAGLAVYLGQKTGAKWLPTIGSQTHDIVISAWWVVAFVPLVAILGIYFWYDVWVWAFRSHDAPTLASATRGFEPLEDLGAELVGRGRTLKSPVLQIIFGRLFTTTKKKDDEKSKDKSDKDQKDETTDDEKSAEKTDSSSDAAAPVAPGEPTPLAIALTTTLVLVPLMYLQVPAAVFGVLYFKMGVRPLAALAISLPSGVGLFLLLGLLSEMVRGSRAAFMALSAVVLSGVLCFSYYPALANQLSPKEVFESYQHQRKTGEPLGLLGVGGRTAAYYAGGQPPIFKDSQSAFNWLASAETGPRRFLATTSSELARLNSAYRAQPGKFHAQNVPVLDARSSQILLVASYLADGDKNENPLSKIVFSEPPKPQHRLDVNMEDTLEVIGFDLIDDETGKFVDTVTPRKKYHFKTYYKVLAPIAREWEPFIHIDGYRRRHNGDHKMVDGKYPYALWQVGDYIADEYELNLEPNFSPGQYTIYFGLFQGEARLKIKSGPADNENRINGGPLHVK